MKGWSLQCNGKIISFCEVNSLQMVPNGDEWQGKRMLYITLICHRTEYHGSSCIWPAGSRCQETFMSQWLHWWLSSLYFVVSHKGILPGPSFPQFEVKIPPTVITSKTLFKRKINQFGIQKHT